MLENRITFLEQFCIYLVTRINNFLIVYSSFCIYSAKFVFIIVTERNKMNDRFPLLLLPFLIIIISFFNENDNRRAKLSFPTFSSSKWKKRRSRSSSIRRGRFDRNRSFLFHTEYIPNRILIDEIAR